MINALRLYDLHKTYNNRVHALKGINLEIKEGDFFALLGKNGAGKSTTIGIVATLVNITSGRVEVFGHDLHAAPWAAKRLIGFVPQEINLNVFEKTARVVVQQGGYYGLTLQEAQANAKHYLQQLELWDKRNDVVGELSGGMKRRLMIARALVHQPKILILDEPTAGVDVEIRRTVWNFLEELNASGTTIILTTHYLEEAERLCRNIAIIKAGEIIVDTSMKKLLTTVDRQTYKIVTITQMQQAPALRNVQVRYLDETTLHVTTSRDYSLNTLFYQLSRNQIQVASITPTSGQLEELFVNLTSIQ